MGEGFETLEIERRDKGKGEIRYCRCPLCVSLLVCRICYQNRGFDLNLGGERDQMFGRISTVP